MGASALVLIATGLARAFGGFEKGTAYYLHEPLFHLKMTALVLILLLEIVPMLGLLRWRGAVRRQQPPDLRRARTYVRIGHWQAVLVMVIVFAAAGMARGIGLAG
ncbi:putative membrane protein [Burkholderia vietnamiensis]